MLNPTRACLLFFVLTTAMFVESPAYGQTALWRSYVDGGLREYSKGNLSEAEKLFTSGLNELDPKSNPAEYGANLEYLALVERDQGKLSEAKKNITKAIEFVETSNDEKIKRVGALWKFELGEIVARSGDSDQGERLMKSALKDIETTYGKTHGNVARALQRLSDYYASKGKNIEAKALSGEAQKMLISLGTQGTELPDDPQQRALLQQNKVAASYLNDEGAQLLLKKDFVGAKDKFEQALRIDPTNNPARTNLAITHQHAGLAALAAKDEITAVAECRNSVELFERMNPTGTYLADSLDSLASAFQAVGKDEAAAIAISRAALIRAQAYGRDDSKYIATLEREKSLRQKLRQTENVKKISEQIQQSKQQKFANEIAPYKWNLRRSVQAEWQKRSGSMSNLKLDDRYYSAIEVAIDKSGMSKSVTLKQSSTNREIDRIALDSVKACFPFLPPPAGPNTFTMTIYIRAKSGVIGSP